MLELLALKLPLKSLFESYIRKFYCLPPHTSRNKAKVSGIVFFNFTRNFRCTLCLFFSATFAANSTCLSQKVITRHHVKGVSFGTLVGVTGDYYIITLMMEQ